MLKLGDKKNNGFTLVEMLVVLSILSLFAAVGFMTFSSLQKKARDDRRKSDLKNVQVALRLYFQSKNQYPPVAIQRSTESNWEAELGAELQNYLPKMPVDPVNRSPYNYYYTFDGVDYILCAQLEDPNDPNVLSTPDPVCNKNYALRSADEF